MSAEDRPQVYLITPPEFDPAAFGDTLAQVLDTVEIACLRLSMATQDEDRIARAADAVRLVSHARDVAVVIDTHLKLVERHGLDGVHLTDGARTVRFARKELGADAVVGAFCGTSRHDGMNAGEAGADYVAFGPMGSNTLGTGATVDRDLFAWWSEMIEVPIVAEGALTPAIVKDFAPVTDFFGVGEEIWAADNPAAALQDLITALG